MKKSISFFLSIVLLVSLFGFDSLAQNEEEFKPYVVVFSLTTEDNYLNDENVIRATGLISSYGLNISKTGTTLNISGRTNGYYEVVRTGFKDLTVERRKTSSDSWKDYYEYGNVYRDAIAALLTTTLVVEAGYQYRVTCKHYAKKNLLSIQTISNTSNIVTVS